MKELHYFLDTGVVLEGGDLDVVLLHTGVHLGGYLIDLFQELDFKGVHFHCGLINLPSQRYHQLV